MQRLLLAMMIGVLLLACSSIAVATQVFDSAQQQQTPMVPITAQVAFGGCGGPRIATINPEFEQAVIEQTNEIRMRHGLPPLRYQADLAYSARYHAADMSASNYFNHDTYSRLGGDLMLVCDTWQRIEAYYSDWEALAENIAAGQRSPEIAMDGWMNSPDHKANILSDAYTEIGVGFYQGSGEYRFYWDQNFGRRSGVYPIVLDGEKALTHDREVRVYVHGDFDTMRLNVDGGAWTVWMPFENAFSWRLPESPGQHTVTVEVRSELGRYTSSDTILYEPK